MISYITVSPPSRRSDADCNTPKPKVFRELKLFLVVYIYYSCGLDVRVSLIINLKLVIFLHTCVHVIKYIYIHYYVYTRVCARLATFSLPSDVWYECVCVLMRVPIVHFASRFMLLPRAHRVSSSVRSSRCLISLPPPHLFLFLSVHLSSPVCTPLCHVKNHAGVWVFTVYHLQYVISHGETAVSTYLTAWTNAHSELYYTLWRHRQSFRRSRTIRGTRRRTGRRYKFLMSCCHPCTDYNRYACDDIVYVVSASLRVVTVFARKRKRLDPTTSKRRSVSGEKKRLCNKSRRRVVFNDFDIVYVVWTCFEVSSSTQYTATRTGPPSYGICCYTRLYSPLSRILSADALFIKAATV